MAASVRDVRRLPLIIVQWGCTLAACLAEPPVSEQPRHAPTCTPPLPAADEALAALQQGARLRCTCATVNNAESSRSHAVFVLELTIRSPKPDGSWLEQTPRLVMMDLAGGAAGR